MPRTHTHDSQYAGSLIEASLDPLVIINTEGKITDMNQANIDITGLSHDELMGTSFFVYFTDPQKAEKLYVELFSKGSFSNIPLTIHHKNSQLTDVLFNGSVFTDAKSKAIGAVLVARDISEQKWAIELRDANKELAFQNDEKEKRALELIIANKELAFQNDEKEKRALELIIANKELAFQNDEKGKRAEELIIANKELAFQNDEKEKRALEFIIANKKLAFQNEEKGKRAEELIIANRELAFQNDEKEKRALELIIANKELAFQNEEKGKRAEELIIANKELAFQNEEKGKRAEELIIANRELAFQNEEKRKRAAELAIAEIELNYQNKEKDKQEKANRELREFGNTANLASKYSLSLIEASLDPLITISPKGKITDMNEALAKITGISRAKITGTDFFDYFTEPDMAKKVYKEVFAKGSVTDSPLTLRNKNGKLTDVLFNGSVYKDDSDNVLGVVVVARDITEQKRSATKLKDAIVFAEKATGRAEDAKIEAESATHIAENAVKAKQQFLSNMSHEIRTPMNAIIGFTKVVLKTELSAKQREYLTAIKRSGDSLIVLINDILDLAKVDAGKMTFEQVPFKLPISISAMIHLFETKIQEKNLKLIKEYDPGIPDVLVGDPVRLHQIILNLMSNAVKFTHKGNIAVSARLLNENNDNVNIEFSVKDTGIGIAKEKMETIFENFQQASSATSRLYGGTGLGLAIVKQLVEQQGGTISLTSKVDEGSVFSFVLPFLKTNAEAPEESGTTEQNLEPKEIKVLVVEDIALNQLLMKTLLDDFGVECEIAANGKIATEMMQANSYDIVLMDLQMPEMNGFEATEYIRNKLNSKIPIIALTADVTTVDLAKCKAVGMNDYIAKPVDERLLYSKIIEHVKKKNLQAKPNEDKKIPSQKKKSTDMAYLIRLTKSNPDLMMQMISLYLEQTPAIVNSMKKALHEEDWELLHASAHKIIPSFAIVGLDPEYETIAKKIKDYKNPQLMKKEVSDMVHRIESICLQSCIDLKEEFHLIKKRKDDLGK